MYNLVNLPKDELSIIIEKTSEAKNLSPAIIENDLWVSVILDYLFAKSPWKDSLAFKGGTSLSKAFNLIERFSEDIDLILDWRVIGYDAKEPLAERSNTKQDALNKEFDAKTEKFLKTIFIPKLKEDLTNLINRNLDINYEDEAIIISYGNDYLDRSILRAIRLEIGAKAAWTPTEIAEIRPYIAEVYPEQFGDASVSVRTTTPERTFWEKATILHHEANRPDNLPIPSRFSRHYYDVYRMAKLGILDRALEQSDLLKQVADFKAKFYPRKWARYDLARLGTLRLIPSEVHKEALRRDYAKMASMIYGERPDFDNLMAEIAKIEAKINGKYATSHQKAPQIPPLVLL